jgi:HEAT repeat protein
VRSAAVQAIAMVGKAEQTADLVALLSQTQDTKERANLERSILAITGRAGTACVRNLVPLVRSDDAALRMVGVRTLASVGGTEALAAVTPLISDPAENVQDEAVRTLSTWPSNWPEDVGVADVLLGLAKTGKKASHHVLGVRGYLQYLQGDRKLSNDQKTAKLMDLLTLLQAPEERRMAIAVMGGIPTARVLESLVGFAADPATAEEASSAIVKVAGGDVAGASKEQRQKALELAIEKSQVDATKRKAREALKGI